MVSSTSAWLVALEEPPPFAIPVSVLEVFDGDGFLTRVPKNVLTEDTNDKSEIEVGVRCGFIDAPELNRPGGPEAREVLTRLIGGKKDMDQYSAKSEYG